MTKKENTQTKNIVINPFQGKSFSPESNSNDTDAIGEKYEEPDRSITEDLQELLKVQSLEYGDLLSTISKLEKDLKNSKITNNESLDAFVKKAFPLVTDEMSAFNLITYLIAQDQYSPTSWYNSITQNSITNKLNLIQSIINISKRGKK